uniref:Uncharacterized protein n=1 Tax=Rhodnius prolixus TaxID=13249 RepID=T1IBW4_RHOPR
MSDDKLWEDILKGIVIVISLILLLVGLLVALFFTAWVNLVIDNYVPIVIILMPAADSKPP